MHLTNDQQKRLIAAEMAIKSKVADASPDELIEAAGKWLEFINAGEYAPGKVIDAVDKLKRDAGAA
jgi:hypothetical protein